MYAAHLLPSLAIGARLLIDPSRYSTCRSTTRQDRPVRYSSHPAARYQPPPIIISVVSATPGRRRHATPPSSTHARADARLICGRAGFVAASSQLHKLTLVVSMRQFAWFFIYIYRHACWGEGRDATLRSSPFAAVAGLTKTKRAGTPFASFSTRRRPAVTSPRGTASSCSEAHV
jgi:hypothetical protein